MKELFEKALFQACSNAQAKSQKCCDTGLYIECGALLVEQNNKRLKNADHRFHLWVNSTKSPNNFTSKWKVESDYGFEPFSKGYVTDIPLAKGFVLKLPDGLSHYLTKIGVAKEFKYTSTWQEAWK